MKGTKPTAHKPGIKRNLWQVLDSEGTVISVFDRVDHAYDFKKKLSDSYYLGKYSLNYSEGTNCENK